MSVTQAGMLLFFASRREEREEFLLLAAGRLNREFAAEFHLSEATVRVHVGHILAKLGLRDRAQAVVLASETGLVVTGSPLAAS